MFETTTTTVHDAVSEAYSDRADSVIVGSVDWKSVQEQTSYLGTVEAEWDVWNGVPPHPIQRGTVYHAAKLVHSGVLEKPLDLHRSVAACIVGDVAQSRRLFATAGVQILTDSAVVKLDGHSRTKAQAEGKAPKPERVIVHIYAASSEATSADLYQGFDSTVSSKKVADKGQSALSAVGIKPESSLFQGGAVVLKSLKLSASIIDEGSVHTKTVNGKKPASDEEMTLEQAMAERVPGYELAQRFKPQLLALDSLNITARIMPANADAIAAYIAILVKDPVQAGPFLENLRAGKGELVDGVADALFMASQAVKVASDKRRKLKGLDRTSAVVATIINAFAGYKASATYDVNKSIGHPSAIVELFAAERRAAAKVKPAE